VKGDAGHPSQQCGGQEKNNQKMKRSKVSPGNEAQEIVDLIPPGRKVYRAVYNAMLYL
jgi:hypothetical protein